MFDIPVVVITASTLTLAYYLASLGHSIVEKSGVLNLAIDGVFVLGIALAFTQAIYTGNNVVNALLTSMVIAMIIGAFMSFIVTKFPVSHGAVGLSLMFLCYGLAGVIGVPARIVQSRTGQEVGYVVSSGDITWVYVYLIMVVLGIFTHMLIEKTKFGAMIRACGEDPLSAEALGVNVLYTRLLAGLIGFGLIGLGAGVFELFYSRIWREGAGMGHGWIAFAISLSSGRHPILGIITSFLFALLYESRFAILAYGLPRELAESLPFITAILAMIIYMVTPLKRKLAPPKSLGKPFFKEERTI